MLTHREVQESLQMIAGVTTQATLATFLAGPAGGDLATPPSLLAGPPGKIRDKNIRRNPQTCNSLIPNTSCNLLHNEWSGNPLPKSMFLAL